MPRLATTKRFLPLLILITALLVTTGCDQSSLTGDADEGPETTSPYATTAAEGDDSKIPDQYIVVFNDDVQDAPGLARQLTADQNGTLRHTYEHALKGFAANFSAQAAQALENNPNVAYVEQDQKMWAIGMQEGATWGLDRTDQRDNDLDGIYTYNATGDGVTAYIIDTGILFSHEDFGGRADFGFDAFDDGQDGEDCNGHGTHVAGTVGGGEWGVAKGVSLVAVRVLDCSGSGTVSSVAAGVDWVTEQAEENPELPAVANMSLGGGASGTLDDAVRASIEEGVQYSVAAGNGNRGGVHQDACDYSPARVEEAMTISATDDSDTKASWANYGDCVDWFAPGVSITSAWIDDNDDTRTISGTSMAAPHTAGVAALYLEGDAGASPQEVRNALYDATTKDIVDNSRTANNHLLYSLLDDDSSGNEEGDTNEPPTAEFSYSAEDLTVDFEDESSDSDGDVTAWNWDFGDGATSTSQNPSHTYDSEGTYTVTLTVTDDDGATDTATEDVGVRGSSDDGDFPLTADGYKVRGRHTIDLMWDGATSDEVEIYRDSSPLTTTANDGSYTDETDNRGGGSYTYQVCEADDTDVCSNEVTVTF